MPKNLQCNSIAFSQAADFYSKYEHLGNPGRGVYHWGAFQEDTMVGAVSFGSACFALHRGIFSELSGRHQLRVYQLTRGGTAPFAPRFTGSWLVSQGLRNLRQLRGDSIVVAYSDRHFGEIGTIYQAANFVYLGKTDPKGQSDYVINGQDMSGWKVRRKFGTRDMSKLQLIDPAMIRIPLQPKFRYLFPATRKSIKRRILADIAHLIRPYPTRENEGVKSMCSIELVKS